MCFAFNNGLRASVAKSILAIQTEERSPSLWREIKGTKVNNAFVRRICRRRHDGIRSHGRSPRAGAPLVVHDQPHEFICSIPANGQKRDKLVPKILQAGKTTNALGGPTVDPIARGSPRREAGAASRPRSRRLPLLAVLKRCYSRPGSVDPSPYQSSR
jgi:hypothetical protein